MKFYNSIGPNPQVVRMFAAERGIDLDSVDIDLMSGENRQAEYMKKNPTGQSPCLELDDGSYLAEITAICEYLDETNPGESLIGSTPEERAKTRMWVRRIDLNIVEPLTSGFRYAEGLSFFKDRITVLPEAAEGLKGLAQEKLTWLDGLMGDNEFVCGSKVTLADLLLYCFLAFGNTVGQPLNPENRWLAGWFERMSARPSAQA